MFGLIFGFSEGLRAIGLAIDSKFFENPVEKLGGKDASILSFYIGNLSYDVFNGPYLSMSASWLITVVKDYLYLIGSISV